MRKVRAKKSASIERACVGCKVRYTTARATHERGVDDYCPKCRREVAEMVALVRTERVQRRRVNTNDSLRRLVRKVGGRE